MADRVIGGQRVVDINGRYHKATNADGTRQTEADWKVVPTHVETGVSIGSGSTSLCGLTIGEDAVIGAGSVVTKSVPNGEVWAGNPASFLKLAHDS